MRTFNYFLYSYFFNMKPASKRTQDSVSNFIEKTYNILENEENANIVAWTAKGTSFIIKEVKRFEQEILPIYFKHSNFSSFVRQLNMYNFHKVRGDRLDCEFEHEKFKKGQRQLLCKIKRKQSESFIISQNVIQENQGNQSMQESSQNLKKYSQVIINSDFGNKDLVKVENGQKNDVLLQELQNLRKENKNLRAIKQSKLQKQKMLNTSASSTIGQKFFKLTTCLLAQKLQKQLKIESISTQVQRYPFEKDMSFDQIIEHVLSNCQTPLQFVKYHSTAKSITNQQSDFDFMIKKANNFTLSSTGQVQGRLTLTESQQ